MHAVNVPQGSSNWCTSFQLKRWKLEADGRKYVGTRPT